MSTHISKNAVQLDLSTQRLFIHPDAALPKFHPRPKAVMVTPIYDYDRPIPTPTMPNDEEGREALLTYGYNAAHGAMYNPSRARRPNKLQRRDSSFSPPRGRPRRRQYTSPYPSQPYYPATSYSGNQRSRPSTHPLAYNPPD